MIVFAVGGGAVAVLFVLAVLRAPGFGGDDHPYRDRAVAASLQQVTPNVVASINFDQRALDTLGEETILLASVVGAATLLRSGSKERDRKPVDRARATDATRLAGYLLLPVILLIGLNVVAHGHLTPGGGFQGGVVIATGVHLLYIAGSYTALCELRPLRWYEYGEAVGGGTFAVFGVVGLFTGAGFLANILPLGQFGALVATGSVPLLNFAVGAAVASGVVVLLAQFIETDLRTEG
jgi:multicomponent Na+:H+ antiporter subunit B